MSIVHVAQPLSPGSFAQAEAHLAKGRNKNDRPLGANRRLVRLSEDDIAVRYYSTYIVTYHRDGTTTIYLGGYNTVTTRKWINYYSPARVYTHKGQPAVSHSSDPITPPKIQRCRRCWGFGDLCHHCYSRAELLICGHDSTRYRCWGCEGKGKRDYGSKPLPTLISLYAAIRVDSTGKIIGLHREDHRRSGVGSNTPFTLNLSSVTNLFYRAAPKSRTPFIGLCRI